jgi:hypothetical protein
MKTKIRHYILYILLFYIIAIFIKNRLDTDNYKGELSKITFLSVEKLNTGILSKFAHKAKSTNPELGWIYILNKCYNCPEEILPNKEYSVYIEKLQAHSWLDFLKFGTKYDYEIREFAKGK